MWPFETAVCTYAAWTPQLNGGGQKPSQSPGMSKPAFFQSHICHNHHPPPPPFPADSWPPNQQRSTAYQHPSRSVNQCPLIAGNSSRSGSQPALAPSVLRLWRRCSAAEVGSHCHAASLQATWARRGPGGESVPLQSVRDDVCSPADTLAPRTPWNWCQRSIINNAWIHLPMRESLDQIVEIVNRIYWIKSWMPALVRTTF